MEGEKNNQEPNVTRVTCGHGYTMGYIMMSIPLQGEIKEE